MAKILFVGQNGLLITGAQEYLRCAEDQGILKKASTERHFQLRDVSTIFDDKESTRHLNNLVETYRLSVPNITVLKTEASPETSPEALEQLADNFCRRYTDVYHVIY